LLFLFLFLFTFLLDTKLVEFFWFVLNYDNLLANLKKIQDKEKRMIIKNLLGML